MATAPIIKVRLEASDEREAIARFIEYTFDKNWVVQDVIDAIRDGSYLEYVRKLISASPIDVCPAVTDGKHVWHSIGDGTIVITKCRHCGKDASNKEGSYGHVENRNKN